MEDPLRFMADNGSSFTMTAGEISGNQNYGVYDHWDGRFTISGASYIKDNTTSDVYLEQSSNAKAPNWNRKIKIAGPLADDVKIGVRIYKNNGRDGLMPGIFTDGLPSNGSADNFFSSVDRYRVFSADNGEAELSEFSTITFDSNGGSEVEQQIVQNGKTVIWPEDPTLDHYTFVDWYQVLGNSAEDGSEVLSEIPFGFDGDDNAETVYGDITLVAVWGDAVECAAALQVWIFAALTRRALSLCRECSTDAAALRVWTLAALIRRICGMRAAWITCSKAALHCKCLRLLRRTKQMLLFQPLCTTMPPMSMRHCRPCQRALSLQERNRQSRDSQTYRIRNMLTTKPSTGLQTQASPKATRTAPSESTVMSAAVRQ